MGLNPNGITMPTAEANGMRLFYQPRGRGQPIIFAHGIPTDYRAWSAQLEPFSNEYRAITYSRRLAKPNQNEEDYEHSTVENNSADLVGLVQKLGVSPIHLVGHSYGGFIAAYCAAKNPELIRTLTLVEPAVSTILVKDRKNPIQLLSLLLRSPSTAISAARFTSNSLNPSLAAFRRGDFDSALRFNLDGIMNKDGAFEQFPEPVRIMMKENEKTVGEIGTELPLFGTELSSRISAPTLLINGAKSPKFFHAIVDKLARSIPNSKVARISGSAHFPHIENPGEFNALLLEFLKAHN